MELNYFRHNKKEPAHSLGTMKISFNEITILLSGEMTYYVDDTRYDMKSGDAIFIPNGAIRFRGPVEKSDYVSFNYHSESQLDHTFLFPEAYDDILRHLLYCCDAVYMQSNNLQDERLHSLLATIKLELLRQGNQKKENPIVVQIKEYVHENLSKKLTLASISKITYFSPVYCDTLFSKHVGKSIINYVIDERINLAKNLLWDVTISLTDVALKTGFEDYNYFSRTFKKRVGISPTQFRKIAKQ